MKINAVLADTGRPVPTGGAVNLLNAGWTFTTALAVSDGGYTLPGQALAVFIEAPWDQLNRPHRVVIELVDDDHGRTAEFANPEGAQPARVEQEITVPSVPGAPNGTPGLTSILLDIPGGTIRITEARRRYVWRINIGEEVGEVGFWVGLPPQAPIIGIPAGS